MSDIRRLFHSHRCWAIVLLSLALLVKVMMPAGFVPVVSGKTITVELCSSSTAGSMQIHIPMEAPADDGDKAGKSCAFAGLGLQGLAAADPVQLGQALLFVYTAALFVADLRLPQHESYLRPPSRGPPSIN